MTSLKLYSYTPCDVIIFLNIFEITKKRVIGRFGQLIYQIDGLGERFTDLL